MLKTLKNDLKVATESEKNVVLTLQCFYCVAGKSTEVSNALNVRTGYSQQQFVVTLVIHCPLCVWSMDLTGGQFTHIVPLMFLRNKMVVVFFMFTHWT